THGQGRYCRRTAFCHRRDSLGRMQCRDIHGPSRADNHAIDSTDPRNGRLFHNVCTNNGGVSTTQGRSGTLHGKGESVRTVISATDNALMPFLLNDECISPVYVRN
ncbi:unnamed protein product, partial [Cuscuta campestris]